MLPSTWHRTGDLHTRRRGTPALIGSRAKPFLKGSWERAVSPPLWGLAAEGRLCCSREERRGEFGVREVSQRALGRGLPGAMGKRKLPMRMRHLHPTSRSSRGEHKSRVAVKTRPQSQWPERPGNVLDRPDFPFVSHETQLSVGEWERGPGSGR